MTEKTSFKCSKMMGDSYIIIGEFYQRLWKKIVGDIEYGKEFWVTIEEKRPTRTEAQHRYYFVYLGIIADETGEDKEALHEHFKKEHLYPKIMTCYGLEVEVYPSTKDLTIKEFMDYIKRIEVESGIKSPSTTLNGLDYYIDKM